MKSKHIIELLDKTPFNKLIGDDLAQIQNHCAGCSECRQAMEAARISSILLQLRIAVPAPAPSPFFEAKVMNALRTREIVVSPLAAFRRWWQASYALVSLMILTVLSLFALTILAPASNANDAQAGVTNYNLYSTDSVILNQKSSRDLTNEQVFEVIYNTRNEVRKNEKY